MKSEIEIAFEKEGIPSDAYRIEISRIGILKVYWLNKDREELVYEDASNHYQSRNPKYVAAVFQVQVTRRNRVAYTLDGVRHKVDGKHYWTGLSSSFGDEIILESFDSKGFVASKVPCKAYYRKKSCPK